MKTFSLYRSSKSLLSFLLLGLMGLANIGELHADHDVLQIDKAEEIESIETESPSEVQEGIDVEEKYLGNKFVLFQLETKGCFIQAMSLRIDPLPLIGIDPPPEPQSPIQNFFR